MKHDKMIIMVILSSPSGVGKTTLVKKFNKNRKALKFLFHTQLGLQDQMKLDGKDYKFVNENEFKKLIKNEPISRIC